MAVTIKRKDKKVIFTSGECENIKECLETNLCKKFDEADLKKANLSCANLNGISLRYADIRSANMRFAYLPTAQLKGANLSNSDLYGTVLCGADLSGANLSNSVLWFSNMQGADLITASIRNTDLLYANFKGTMLYKADLTNIKNYSDIVEIFQELCRCQPVHTFTEKEWSMIGIICIHQLCWDSIHKRFGKDALSIFKKLSKKGWKEYENKYRKVLHDDTFIKRK